MGAGDHFESHVDVRGQFLEVPGLSGIIARCCDAAGEVAGIFESTDVISLPTVHGDFNIAELPKGLVRIDAKAGVQFFCVFVTVHNGSSFMIYPWISLTEKD